MSHATHTMQRQLKALTWIRQGILPVVSVSSEQQALEIAEGLLLGGISQIEITLRTPAALPAIKAIGNRFPDMALAAGTILNHEQFDQARDAGASLFISPGLTESLAKHALEHDLLWIPGIATASEAMRAIELGFSTLKFFPAMAAGGPAALKGITAPLQGLKIIPTGGITLENCLQWKAVDSVVAIGGSWLTGELDAKNVTQVVQTRALAATRTWAGLD